MLNHIGGMSDNSIEVGYPYGRWGQSSKDSNTWYFFEDLKWWSLCLVSSYNTILPIVWFEFQEWWGLTLSYLPLNSFFLNKP